MRAVHLVGMVPCGYNGCRFPVGRGWLEWMEEGGFSGWTLAVFLE